MYFCPSVLFSDTLVHLLHQVDSIVPNVMMRQTDGPRYRPLYAQSTTSVQKLTANMSSEVCSSYTALQYE